MHRIYLLLPSVWLYVVRQWYCDNGYPRNIEYTQCDGQKKCYHVIWHDADVA